MIKLNGVSLNAATMLCFFTLRTLQLQIINEVYLAVKDGHETSNTLPIIYSKAN